jgi:hypothetical protein
MWKWEGTAAAVKRTRMLGLPYAAAIDGRFPVTDST